MSAIHNLFCLLGDNTEGLHAIYKTVFVVELSLDEVLYMWHTKWLTSNFLSMAGERFNRSGEHYNYIQ